MTYPVSFQGSLNIWNVPDEILATHALAGTHRFYTYDTYSYEGGVPEVPSNWEVLSDNRGTGEEEERGFRFLYEVDGNLAVIQWSEGDNINLRILGTTREAATQLLEIARTLFPRADEPPDDYIPIKFWSWNDQRGPVAYRRQILVPTWEEIAGNYPPAVRGPLTTLVSVPLTPSGGQLILFTGEPGTGKTYALRALGREWKEWASLEYVTDPGPFFSGSASYLISTLLDAGSENYFHEGRKEKKWRVLILEDAGEFLAVDAKQKTRDGISRLLNVVDGLIGQGLRVMVLATTNEELGKLHPAISRPGRCSFNLKFLPFTVEEANAWRARHGLPEESGPGMDRSRKTLAQLYAEQRGEVEDHRVAESVGAGFRV